jgi:hypothetical protein
VGERPAIPEALRHALEKARSLGFLGPAPVDAQVRHSEGLAAVAARYFERFGRGAPDVVLELGSGGGVPGLVLAAAWPDAEFILLDSNHRRTAFLVETVHALGWDERARVICERAEVAGHDAALRGSADFVVSRSFGSPAATAECGAPFLSVGGLLVVTEPPPPVDSETRWPLSGLSALGLVPLGFECDPVSVQVLEQETECPPRFPRRTGVPSRRPIF